MHTADKTPMSASHAQGLRLSAQYLDAEQLDVIATIEGGAGWMVDDARWKLIAYRDWCVPSPSGSFRLLLTLSDSF